MRTAERPHQRSRHLVWRVMARVVALVTMLSMGFVTFSGETAEASAPVRSSLTKVSYGSLPGQWVQLGRPAASGRRPAVIFIHGGGWVGGSVAAWEAESAYWVSRGWVGINASYRTAPRDGATATDGQKMLYDMGSVLRLARNRPEVDRSRIVVVGDSAGGHLAAWMAARYHGAVAGMILWSPVGSPAIAESVASTWDDAADCPVLCDQQRSLGVRAHRIFGYSASTTSPLTYLARDGAVPTWVAGSAREWVPFAANGGAICAASHSVCSTHLATGDLHATKLRDADHSLVVSARHWAAHLVGVPAF